jgi:hypothetical protein
MYVVYNISHIHPFSNVPKKSILLINMSGGSTIVYSFGCIYNNHINQFRVMLTCTLMAYDKLPKNKNVAFNDKKNLMLK